MSDDVTADDIFHRRQWTPGVGALDRSRPMPMQPATVERTIRLTPASTVQVRPVHWLWEGRIALGSLSLLGGREGIGKSILAYTLGADITKGTLPGVYLGKPRSVIVAATEDSWSHTIAPRLMAAGADLTRIYRVDVHTEEGVDMPLSLPVDIPGLTAAAKQADVGLILLDPLLSRLDSKLDSHKDANVRVALEPLVALAEETASWLAVIFCCATSSL